MPLPLSDSVFAERAAQVRAGKFSRKQMRSIREKAEKMVEDGDMRAQLVIDAVNQTAVPKLEKQYAFLGFCTDGTINSRLDGFWMEAGICKFDNIKNKIQTKQFTDIETGDTIILKKVLDWGVSIELVAYGEVLSRVPSAKTGLPYFHVDWHEHDEYLIVPSMGSLSTVDIRSTEMVEGTMEQDFWDWLSMGRRVPNQHNRHLCEGL
jgi:hypothetical protein